MENPESSLSVVTFPYINISQPSRVSTPSTSSTSGCVSGDEVSESSAVPTALLGSQLILQPNASIEDLTSAISKCKELVLSCDQCSEERKWLVRYLVELRFRIQELKDVSNNPSSLGVTYKGHHFKTNTNLNTNVKLTCDHCSGVIWSVVQGSYACEDCGYICHSKCVGSVIRVCAHIIATEGHLETNICIQNGLAAQNYKCAECKVDLNFKGKWSEPRLCDYSGLYYCSTCHWNNMIEIPARIVHNWDWEKKLVSQAAYQLLNLTRNRPLINLEKANNKLVEFVTELDMIRKMRCDLRHMRRYLVECQNGTHLITGDMLHMAETTNLYSVENLELARDGLLEAQLSRLTEKCRLHITNCEVCHGKGYFCELCKSDDVIFPFDSCAIGCEKCNSYYHRSCWNKSIKKCLKCTRIHTRFNELTDEWKDHQDIMDFDDL